VATWFHPAAARVLAAGASVLLAAAAEGAERLTIDCVLDQMVPVADATLAESRQHVARIFEPLAVHVVWGDIATALARQEALPNPTEKRAFVTSLYVIRLVPPEGDGGMTPSERSLGSAAVGTRIALIPFRRVQELARNRDVPLGLVLGHVMAHELGHLLLRRSTHSAAGLMQATLDLRLAQQGRLLFTASEAQAIRAELERNAALR
jgi:hypothetical protein